MGPRSSPVSTITASVRVGPLRPNPVGRRPASRCWRRARAASSWSGRSPKPTTRRRRPGRWCRRCGLPAVRRRSGPSEGPSEGPSQGPSEGPSEGVVRATYLVLLAACALGTLPLELLLHTRVYARWRRWLLAVLPVFVLFAAWDIWAIAAGQWRYDQRQMSGLVLPGGLPLEEALFFVVVPTCAILTLEAVRAVRGWPVGDEPQPVPESGRR